uniref:HTH CENPB-type domain-containing protein n=1 Tax=Ditylenchus dipsaci TaxID=166011 RepID=A0A915DP20_9BILA
MAVTNPAARTRSTSQESAKHTPLTGSWRLSKTQSRAQFTQQAKSTTHRCNILDWIKKEQGLLLIEDSSAAGKKRKMLREGGRPLTFADLDKELAKWIREQRAKKFRVSRRIKQQQADKILNSEIVKGQFTASRGWLEKFLRRHSFRLRVPATVR